MARNSGRFTPQSKLFCELMAEGKKSQIDCYLEAYPKAKTWTRNSAQTAASTLVKKSHIQKRINELKEKADKELIERYVWDKQKGTRTLLKALEKVEKNLDTLSDAQQALIEKAAGKDDIIKTVNKTFYQMNSSAKMIKELASELNSMYGLNKTGVELSGSIAQVVFEGEDELPPDEETVDNEGNELDLEDDEDGNK